LYFIALQNPARAGLHNTYKHKSTPAACNTTSAAALRRGFQRRLRSPLRRLRRRLPKRKIIIALVYP
jgi:hypothetical protein